MKSKDNVEDLIRRANAVPSVKMNRRTLNDIFEAQEESKRKTMSSFEPNILRMILLSKAVCLTSAFLIISSWAACFVLSRRVTTLKDELAQRDVTIAHTNDSATINFYLREHQDVVARTASLNPSQPQQAHMHVSRHDILYYENFDDQPEYISPGIIVKGPSFQRDISLPDIPAISNGHTLTLSEAREAADFDLVSPPWLNPGYMLDQVRRIEGRDALHLLYTDGINTLSLFEQPIDGQRGLSAKDFREYAVYCNQQQAGGTILTWRDDELSYILIGNTEMSQLMNMAQSINVRK